ncbi:hypothetical protein FHX74_003164 [Friedmanniella endophytica]|uniref:Uncharacterized protein n=1 Tax=Microlunatus kandeliicorticis TaxID=1759536 RepID=A0A7W3IUJ6_9ACTN|nr:hypothetical protein [Microlunatus kandeliicorticis]MBA8795528.1 hypothetical protein [Microlunatus kandeliicorticis]
MKITKLVAGAAVGVIAAGAWALPAAAASPYAMNRHFSGQASCTKAARQVARDGAVITQRCTSSPVVPHRYTLTYYYPA